VLVSPYFCTVITFVWIDFRIGGVGDWGTTALVFLSPAAEQVFLHAILTFDLYRILAATRKREIKLRPVMVLSNNWLTTQPPALVTTTIEKLLQERLPIYKSVAFSIHPPLEMQRRLPERNRLASSRRNELEGFNSSAPI
jgi:hypothetical protein